MIDAYIAREAIRLIIRSINVWLMATGQGGHVEARDVTITRRDGVLFIAFRETADDRQGRQR